MALQPEQRQLLEREHRFAEWRTGAEGGGGGGQVVRGFEFKGDEIPGWDLVKSKRNAAVDPPRLDTFWRPTSGEPDALLGIRVVERPSVAAAREALLGVLGDVESAAIKRRTDLNIGDVVFGQEMMLAFARNNLVVLVHNAGPRVVQVIEPARIVDAVVVKTGEKR